MSQQTINALTTIVNVALVVLIVVLYLSQNPRCPKDLKRKLAPKAERKIFLGSEIDSKKYSYVVSMQWRSKHFCAATVISPYWAITTTVCTSRYYENVTIRAGSSNWKKGGTIHTVVNFEMVYGIGLVGVNKRFQCTSAVLADHIVTKAKLPLLVLGWGVFEDVVIHDKLHASEVYLVSRNVCKEAYIRKFKSEICAALNEDLDDTCDKDQGSPLIQNNLVIGIFLWNPRCFQARYPALYTNLTHPDIKKSLADFHAIF